MFVDFAVAFAVSPGAEVLPKLPIRPVQTSSGLSAGFQVVLAWVQTSPDFTSNMDVTL